MGNSASARFKPIFLLNLGQFWRDLAEFGPTLVDLVESDPIFAVSPFPCHFRSKLAEFGPKLAVFELKLVDPGQTLAHFGPNILADFDRGPRSRTRIEQRSIGLAPPALLNEFRKNLGQISPPGEAVRHLFGSLSAIPPGSPGQHFRNFGKLDDLCRSRPLQGRRQLFRFGRTQHAWTDTCTYMLRSRMISHLRCTNFKETHRAPLLGGVAEAAAGILEAATRAYPERRVRSVRDVILHSRGKLSSPAQRTVSQLHAAFCMLRHLAHGELRRLALEVERELLSIESNASQREVLPHEVVASAGEEAAQDSNAVKNRVDMQVGRFDGSEAMQRSVVRAFETRIAAKLDEVQMAFAPQLAEQSDRHEGTLVRLV